MRTFLGTAFLTLRLADLGVALGDATGLGRWLCAGVLGVADFEDVVLEGVPTPRHDDRDEVMGAV